MPPTRTNRYLCTCRLVCALWNPQNNSYGPGEHVSKSTRDNHRADERAKKRQEQPRQAATNPSHNRSEWAMKTVEELQLLSTTPTVSPNRPLVFKCDPTTSGPFRLDVREALKFPNRTTLALARHPSNNLFQTVENRLAELYHLISSLNVEEGEGLLDEIEVIMGKIILEKHIQWNNQRDPDALYRHHVNTDIFFYRGAPRSKAYRCAVLVSLVLQHIYSTPRRAVRTHLAGLQGLLRSADYPTLHLDVLPTDPRTTTTYYKLQPITRRYACCPSCNCIYEWDGEDLLDPSNTVPKYCAYRPTPHDPTCNADLWKIRQLSGNRTRQVPAKVYTHQPFKFWLARLLSRPDLEDHMDQARTSHPDSDGNLSDIWGSPCLQNLKTHNKQPFLPGPLSEGRLILGLAIDSFNPLFVKAAHASISSTAIWIVILNLPPHLRYLHENMYVAGVIPGPSKPSSDEINHFLDLVMDELLEFYKPGVHFSRTFKYELGRLYQAMLIPLICDMLAARQTIGQAAAPSAHNFCTVCDLDQDDIHILDPRQWPAKKLHDVRRWAQLWKEAQSSEQRKKIFDRSGIRWSSLLRLEYWDPTRFTVIDAMHTLDLGLFQNHCRTLFALNADATSGDGTCATSLASNPNRRIYTKAHVAAYRRCIVVVVKNGPDMENDLLDLHRRALHTFCIDNGIHQEGQEEITGVKRVLVNNILEWRRSASYHAPRQDITELSGGTVATDPAVDDEDRGATPEASVDKSLIPTIRLLLNPTSDNIAKLSTSKVTTKNIFINISNLLEIDYTHIDVHKRTAKQDLQDLILEHLAVHDAARERLDMFLPKPSERVVLGKEVLQAVWSDMKKTQTPTWVATAPPNWGTAERGKLSAAQWRVVCTVHLPITLIRLWHNDTGRKHSILDHFMDLVCAVRLANMKSTSPAQIQAYNTHIFRYVSNICKLYPDQKLKPTHHCALHIGQFLESMGPTHSHNSPFFERYINFFHHQNTNSHPGELETTLLKSAACHANLRSLLADDKEIRPLVIEMLETMDSIDREDVRGYRLASILDPSSPTSTSKLKGALVPFSSDRQSLWRDCLHNRGEEVNVSRSSHVASYPQIALQGVCYSTTQHIFRNSVIFFAEVHMLDAPPSPIPTDYGQLKAGFIDLIFHAENPQDRKFYVVVRELIPVMGTAQYQDPFKRYGFASGFLCTREHQQLRVIGLDQVKSHGALSTLDMEGFGTVYHVLCVDRLMNIFTTFEDFNDTIAT